MGLLTAKYAVITGAGRGLGQRLASRYWQAGYNLGLVSRGVASTGQTVSALAPASRQHCDVFECDLADPASVEAIAAEICAKTERVNVLINNAAIQGPIGALEQNDLGAWEQTIRVNLLSPVALCKGLLSRMLNARGRFHPESLGGRGDRSACEFFCLRQREGGARSVQRDACGRSKEPGNHGQLYRARRDEDGDAPRGPRTRRREFRRTGIRRRRQSFRGRRRFDGQGCGPGAVSQLTSGARHHRQVDQRRLGSLGVLAGARSGTGGLRSVHVTPRRGTRPWMRLGGQMSETGSRLGVGLIGCGLIGQKRAKALPMADKLITCADVSLDRAEALAKACGAKAVTDWRAVAENPAVDVLIVATPHHTLAAITLAAVNAGKHVLVEKPAARFASELEPVLAARDNKGVQVHVGFNHRYHRSLRKAKELVSSGALGELMFIRGRYGHGGRIGYEQEWRADPAISGGGELIDQGPHLIDLSRWFLGEFTEVEGWAETYFWKMSVDDNGFMLLKTEAQSDSFPACFLHGMEEFVLD